MKIAMMGSGGVGGYYGAKLAKAGADVHFIARGAHLAQMQQGGLQVEAIDGDYSLERVNATSDPATIGPVDLVIVAVKAYDLDHVAETLRPLIGAHTSVIPLLNGVDAAERIGSAIGIEHVLGGVVYVSSSLAAPGRIRQVSPFNRIRFGELGKGKSQRCAEIEAVFTQAGIDGGAVDNIVSEIWSKYVFIDAASGVAALTGVTMGPLLDDPDARALFVTCMKEVAALARAQGIDLAPNICEETLSFALKAPWDTKPSMLLDLEMGRSLELEELNGKAVRLGQELNIATDVNYFIYTALKFRAGGTGDSGRKAE